MLAQMSATTASTENKSSARVIVRRIFLATRRIWCEFGANTQERVGPKTASIRKTSARLRGRGLPNIEWKAVLTIVTPDTLIRWHRQGFRLWWRWKSGSRGRPRLPRELRHLIAEMARVNATWGEERIAAELQLKLGLSVSPRTVRRYMPRRRGPRVGRSSQPWSTFVRNHVRAMFACDSFVTITASSRTLYVFVILDVGTRQIVHSRELARGQRGYRRRARSSPRFPTRVVLE